MTKLRKKKGIKDSVIDLARARVRAAYQLFDTVAVSFSGGKDSTAVLNLTLEAAEELGRLPVPVFHYDEEAIPYETEDYVRRVAADPRIDFKWLCLPIKHRNACTRKTPYWYPWAPEDESKWVRPMPAEGITWDKVPGFPSKPEHRPDLPDSVGLLFDPAKHGRVGMMLGIRTDESLSRLRSLLIKGQDSRPYIRGWEGGYVKGNLSKVYPIYDWRTADVWTAPDLFGWDYNRAYDLMDKAGIPPNLQRCAPPFGEEPLAALWMFAACFPGIWERMHCRVPGAATAARYSKTELYAFKSRQEKPSDFTYKDWIKYWLAKHPDGYRQEVARRVQRWAADHAKKTTDPLAESAIHPITGISWKFLITIAERGDYKNRKVPRGFVTERQQLICRYNAEIAEMRKAGTLEQL